MALLEGKTACVLGVANRWSIATAIARALHAHGASLVLTYEGDRTQPERNGPDLSNIASVESAAPYWAAQSSAAKLMLPQCRRFHSFQTKTSRRSSITNGHHGEITRPPSRQAR